MSWLSSLEGIIYKVSLGFVIPLIRQMPLMWSPTQGLNKKKIPPVDSSVWMGTLQKAPDLDEEQ